VRHDIQTASTKEDAMSPEQVRTAFADYIMRLNSLDSVQMMASFADDALGNDERRELFESFAAVFQTLIWVPESVYVLGNTVANKFTATGTTPVGKVVTFDGIAVVTFNEEGKISIQHTYWNPETIAEQLER
jgi:ketosteroid isomerase-like protein